MSYVPLKIPPGVFRNGTKYQAKGRWYDADLVRWREGAMQPIGGWQTLLKSVQEAVAAAIADDGGVFTDQTTAANNATANDMTLLPAVPANNDAYYFGHTFIFTELELDVGTAATDGTITWEYYNGTAWAALAGIQDATNSFKVAGVNSIAFTRPYDWAKTTVNGQGPFYYVRARVSSAGTTQALGDQAWIGDAPVKLDAPVRGLLSWVDNNGKARFAFGLPAKCWTYVEGQLIDITPVGFTTGGADATLASGNYGTGPYGLNAYGQGDPSQGTVVEAQTWQFDAFGQLLVALAYSDGKLYSWDLGVANDLVQMTNSPTSCKGIVVTPERFVVALGAGGDRRLVQWADQESLTTWTPASNNQAGDFPLSTTGEILAGRRGRGETLIWTTTDLWAMSYIAGTLVYSFRQVGTNCGAIGRQAMTVAGGRAFWMGPQNFFVYDGYVQTVPCEVSDYVFGDLNRLQASKIAAVTASEFNEVLWYYPSASSTENDRYVSYNWNERTWAIGKVQRTSGVDRVPGQYLMLADAGGAVYDHERGTTYLSPSGTALVPFAESGPIEIAAGDQVMDIKYIIPDDKTLGDVNAHLIATFYPDQAETTYGPFTLANPTSVRLTGRQVRLRVTQVSPGWRVGVPRIDVSLGGLR